ncbi:hypothetical protein DFH09DRAFT_571103 [Mycena vulgaris]|nr:hypothetical protein DFH09DRAFT_571103 [Mycena vulgaris]
MSNLKQNAASPVRRDYARSRVLKQFPEIPEGVVIKPFTDFKECGIQRTLGPDGIERDHLGIPTVELRFKHDTDVSKTDPHAIVGIAKTTRPGFKKEWWDDWEADEHLRAHGPYDHNLPRVVLFRRAAGDFQKYRRFPPNVFKPLWELTFKIYAGILGTTPVWQKADEETEEKEVSDDDFEDEDAGWPKFPARPREPYELYDIKPHIIGNNDEVLALLAEAHHKRDARAERFLADPAKAIQIYLSSYMSDQGLMFSDRNLVNAPHLLRFFVKFLLRNQVLPDKLFQDGLKSALDIIELAGKELPLTSQISKSLPDAFSTACQNFWGSVVGGYMSGADSASAFEASLMAENIEVINAEKVADDADDGGWGAADRRATDWESPASATLLALLGPTVFPLTHAPGAVERSVRRIISINAPPPATRSPAATAADAVEQGLRARMSCVEMGTWPDWDADGSEDAFPTILKQSYAPSESGLNPHSVENTITLLVEPAAAGHLREGMGLRGVWVQLAWLRGPDTEHDGHAKAECPVASEGLWYLDKLMGVLPSYWIPGI